MHDDVAFLTSCKGQAPSYIDQEEQERKSNSMTTPKENNKSIMQAAEGKDFLPENIGEVEFGENVYSKFQKLEEEWFKEPAEPSKPQVNIKKEGDKLNDILGDMVSMALGKPKERDVDKISETIVDGDDGEDTVDETDVSYEEDDQGSRLDQNVSD